MNSLTNIQDFHVDRNWNLVWVSDVPTKVRFFLWRACREVLPSQTNLKAQGLEVDRGCAFCNFIFDNS